VGSLSCCEWINFSIKCAIRLGILHCLQLGHDAL
jgi:hypothetical protein